MIDQAFGLRLRAAARENKMKQMENDMTEERRFKSAMKRCRAAVASMGYRRKPSYHEVVTKLEEMTNLFEGLARSVLRDAYQQSAIEAEARKMIDEARR